ncbi:MAG: hypothetical protein QXR45_02580 [Candidatus Bathyarchaeia archaeon]
MKDFAENVGLDIVRVTSAEPRLDAHHIRLCWGPRRVRVKGLESA